jgi:hypothetical protein
VTVPARVGTAAVLAASIAVGSASPARAWWSVSADAGAALYDAHVDAQRWDAGPRAAFGGTALAGRGALGAGLRVTRAVTTQGIGLEQAPAATVNATHVEALAEARLGRVAGIEVLGRAGGGRVHLGWRPGTVTIDAGGSPVEVRLAPVDTWCASAGLAVRRALAPGWTAAVALERRVFTLTAAHRSGDAVITDEETFGRWDARLELAWSHGRR